MGDTDDFPVDVDFHQGPVSHFLFTLVMNELIKGIQHEVPWSMLFADDIVLIDETKEGVNDKLKRWRNKYPRG